WSACCRLRIAACASVRRGGRAAYAPQLFLRSEMMMTRSCRAVLWLLVFPFLFLGAAASLAVEPDEMLADPALEARARALSAELRCVVCQNQSIDDSNAPLARDLRILLRERLAAGDSDEQVKQFLVDRYGAFVLL